MCCESALTLTRPTLYNRGTGAQGRLPAQEALTLQSILFNVMNPGFV